MGARVCVASTQFGVVYLGRSQRMAVVLSPSGMKAITENYKDNMFTLQTAHTYVKTLLKNTRVAKYLKAKHAEINTEFENMATATRSWTNILPALTPQGKLTGAIPRAM